jgi:hypothetical protein
MFPLIDEYLPQEESAMRRSITKTDFAATSTLTVPEGGAEWG